MLSSPGAVQLRAKGGTAHLAPAGREAPRASKMEIGAQEGLELEFRKCLLNVQGTKP